MENKIEDIKQEESIEQLDEEEVNLENNEQEELQVQKDEEYLEIKSEKVISKRKQKRYEKIRRRLCKPDDIKYQGPLSYRYLRIIAWVFVALGQLAFLTSLAAKLNTVIFPSGLQTFFSICGSLSTPLFIIASFGIVVSGRKNYKNLILMYGTSFLGFGLGISIFYARYISGLMAKTGASIDLIDYVRTYLGSRLELNVFADLFCFVLLHYFINYTPKKYFKDKKIILFRLCSLLPIIYVFTSYIIKIIIAYKDVELPFFVYSFMTTKSPFVFFVFVVISLWIKNRERIFMRLGFSRHEYKEFLFTKRNSLSFSINLSLIIVFFSIVEILFIMISFLVIGIILKMDSSVWTHLLDSLGVGQCTSLIVAIPIIFLYSYTRQHKKSIVDMFIPVGGIVLIVLVYLETIYQFLLNLMSGN